MERRMSDYKSPKDLYIITLEPRATRVRNRPMRIYCEIEEQSEHIYDEVLEPSSETACTNCCTHHRGNAILTRILTGCGGGFLTIWLI